MPTHNGVSGSWSWRVSWGPYSCRKRRLRSRIGTSLADSPVLPSVGSLYWEMGASGLLFPSLNILLLFLRKGARLRTTSICVSLPVFSHLSEHGVLTDCGESPLRVFLWPCYTPMSSIPHMEVPIRWACSSDPLQ